jgi:hypothetical protein
MRPLVFGLHCPRMIAGLYPNKAKLLEANEKSWTHCVTKSEALYVHMSSNV